MTFIKIYKNGKETMIPHKSLPQFEKAGWGVKEDSEKKQEVKQEIVPENSNPEMEDNQEPNEKSESNSEEEWDDSEWDEEDDNNNERLKELEEKPISSMNNAELKEFAQLKNIKIDGLNSNKQLREAIAKQQ